MRLTKEQLQEVNAEYANQPDVKGAKTYYELIQDKLLQALADTPIDEVMLLTDKELDQVWLDMTDGPRCGDCRHAIVKAQLAKVAPYLAAREEKARMAGMVEATHILEDGECRDIAHVDALIAEAEKRGAEKERERILGILKGCQIREGGVVYHIYDPDWQSLKGQ